jgi:hypothetical protein
MNQVNYFDFAEEEKYIFGVLTQRFQTEGSLGAFDVMSIARWKAERARVYAARRLGSKNARSLEEGARAFTSGITRAKTQKEKFVHVCGVWGFPLATGSALLTVCYPDQFSVYDVRVCDQLGDFHRLKNMTNIENLWSKYQRYLSAVRQIAPTGLSLRDCDRWLWGKSRYEDFVKVLLEMEASPTVLRKPRKKN